MVHCKEAVGMQQSFGALAVANPILSQDERQLNQDIALLMSGGKVAH